MYTLYVTVTREPDLEQRTRLPLKPHAEWQDLEWTSAKAPRPPRLGPTPGLWGVFDAELVGTDSERIRLRAGFIESNRSFSLSVWCDEQHVLHLGAFKSDGAAFDPAIYLRTPAGATLSLLLGTSEGGS